MVRLRRKTSYEHFAANVLVIDASALVIALADDGAQGDAARTRLRGEELAAPELIDLEVLSVLRRQFAVGAMDARRAELALRDLRDIPITRTPHRDLLPRCWELRDNLSVYDAAYVALAETLSATLLTADRALVQAPKLKCSVELLTTSR